MKDLSFFLLKNYFGAKMKKGVGTFCHGDSSTSILSQSRTDHAAAAAKEHLIIGSPTLIGGESSPNGHTLEEMILQLELEEEIARRAKLDGYCGGVPQRRMSCVNNSDILRCARNALNQYPRFSLDGKDAMYRSSFRNSECPERKLMARRSVCCERDLRGGPHDRSRNDAKYDRPSLLPPILAGERVVWCKPGVVAKLMGLEAMPVPVRRKASREKSSFMRREQARRGEERQIGTDLKHDRDEICRRMRGGSSSKASEYCVMKPITVEPLDVRSGDSAAGWPMRRYS
ncbi:uncharacterized protein LOC115736684 [Rhodamnia argentea]|uniref:Uncharacterized protein LOC115736684 n=1 Tax=Rhodamnia argentea TaxID=178133 RepID=A0A8B8NPD3_9MYRT|nr:uncharacterized protein LOC115736684 [Rhodamnia argentea]